MEPTSPVQPTQPKSYPVSVHIPHQERYSRGLALATILLMLPKLIILIPHIIVLYVLQVAACIAMIISQIAVLITGRYPGALFGLTSGWLRWQTRVSAYLFGLTDSYPPFQLRD